MVAAKSKKKASANSYAIVETGGKQYRVAPGDVISVERLAVEEGSVVELDRVLLVSEGKKVKVGTPTVEGARVTADVVGEAKDKKIVVFKYKPKVRYRRKKGHRQIHTQLEIKDIVSKGAGE
ncbi:MAG: 50S ribosomal protein L21 [Chloroflexota bacterium]|nr:50S ribosomal protein L21 [Chloroflexota bacterium]